LGPEAVWVQEALETISIFQARKDLAWFDYGPSEISPGLRKSVAVTSSGAICMYSIVFTARTRTTPPNSRAVVEYILWMKKEGYREATMQRYAKPI